MQSEMDCETERIARMISILARRKYIYKSELQRILTACRECKMSLLDIERLMYTIIDESVLYIDDCTSSNPFHICATLQDELNKCRYSDLYQYLSISQEATMEEISLAYQRKLCVANETDLYRKIGLCIEMDGFIDAYGELLLARDILEELSLRRQFGFTSISTEEIKWLVDKMIVESYIDMNLAKKIVESCILEHHFDICESRYIAESKKQETDEYLISVNNVISNNKKTDRGISDGRH